MFFPATCHGFNDWHKHLFKIRGWMVLAQHHLVNSEEKLERDTYMAKLNCYRLSMDLFIKKLIKEYLTTVKMHMI